MCFIYVTEEGPVTLYRGLGAVLVGAAPAQGLYFGGYETAKRFLGGGQSGIGNFSAGIFAQLCGSLAWVPMDVIKERLQVEGQVKVANAYTGSFDAFRYRAFPIHQVTWAPFNGCYFMVYEKLKGLCINAGYEDGHDNLEPIAQVSCGIAAGVVAASVTNPVDVLKTRLQVARANPARWARFEDERENKTVGRMKTSEEVHGASVESLISQEMFPYSSALGALATVVATLESLDAPAFKWVCFCQRHTA
ncbi:unnamed protein product [Durusdinium trenchii]|uniref:Mitochondrial carrier protein n=1 Tax=Durusdinium trenchii TaxID=1381693 RepID=A0ABP0IMF1_9DINO